jgi:hypothetical protein
MQDDMPTWPAERGDTKNRPKVLPERFYSGMQSATRPNGWLRRTALLRPQKWDRARIRPVGAALLIIAMVVTLLALNVLRSDSLGQSRTMYDNPIYRWRISMAVALSQLRDPPAHGYVAYGSIVKYLNHQGLALMAGETPFPLSPAELHALIFSPDRLEQLFREALHIRLDPKLPMVPIVGSEKGEALYYYWSFRLFGVDLTSPWRFYFLLLSVSLFLFFINFFRSPLCILVGVIYLIAHLYALNFAAEPLIITPHNSRFYPALALLPSLHILMLILKRQRPNVFSVSLATGQIFFLFFLIFGRLQAVWQPLCLVAVAIAILPYSEFRSLRFREVLRRFTLAGWPALLVITGLIGFKEYQTVALDPQAYSSETRTHTFWDPLVTGTVSASPTLSALYDNGQEPYSDMMGYLIARQYLRTHNITDTPIAEIVDGKIQINAMKDMGEFDRIMRLVFFDIAINHPVEVLKSFFYYKIYDEYWFITHENLIKLAFPKDFLWGSMITIICSILLCCVNSPEIHEAHFIRGIVVIPLVIIFSFSTIFIMPNVEIADTLLLFFMLIMLLIACIPIRIAMLLRRKESIL